MQTEISIDKAGRVVIPQEVRKALHLRNDDRLRLTQENGRITLEPVRPEGRLVRKNGMLIYSDGGSPVTTRDVREHIRKGYEERERRIWGKDGE